MRPPEWFWSRPLVSSRLLEYELWTRLHARGIGATHGEEARGLLARVALLELSPLVLARVLEPFPSPVRTLDAIHLAAMAFLLGHGQRVRLASYDQRLLRAAEALGVPLADMGDTVEVE